VMPASTAPVLAGPAQAPSAAPGDCNDITIKAQDAQTRQDILNFKWMINLDNSHDNTSILNPIASYSPVIAAGAVTDGITGEAIVAASTLPDTPPPSSDPAIATDRGYLVTILANDGVGTLNGLDYRIGGKHFKMPMLKPDCKVVAELESHPLPLATVRAKVFHDNNAVNNAEDIPVEEGLAGFHITLRDRVGEVVTDWFGNPICTEYLDYPGGTPKPGTGGFCVSDANGDVFIPNMGPNKYAVEAIPPDGTEWIQTSTIEGKHEQDAWLQEGATGFATEGELFGQTSVWMGFVRPCEFGNADDDCPTNNTPGTGEIKGHVRAVALDAEIPVTELGREVETPLLALNNLSGGDEQVWMGYGDQHGNFTIPNVPAGLYQLVVWDEPLDYIITFLTVQVGGGQSVNLGDIGIPDWFGRIRGFVYIDDGIAADGTNLSVELGHNANENGLRDCYDDGDGDNSPFDLNACERAFPTQDLDTRAKDGSVESAAFSDRSGYYEFTEAFPKLAFIISEVGYGRFKNTGAASYATDLVGNPLNYPGVPVNTDPGLAGLLQATINWAGLTNWIDWGKKPFAPGENGGIVGIVFNDVTRNELNARLEAPEDYEPGVPGAIVNLYAPQLVGGKPVYDSNGEIVKDHLANTYVADDWYANLPTGCLPKGTLGRDPTQVQPYPAIWDQCLELLSVQNQARSGVFDGGYAFDLDCSNPAASDKFNPDQLLTNCDPIQAGWWVVEVAPPTGYQVVKEEDINVFSGDVFVPQIPPPPCVGPKHVVDVMGIGADGPNAVYNPDFAATTGPLAPLGGSPYEGQEMPLCNERLVRLQKGQNANSDFFIFTEVPPPGRLQGLLTDDLHNELDPMKPMYGDKRGIPNAPIGIRDYTGKLLQVVYTDDNGYFEALVPSTGTYNCPLPAGPCPGMYFIVGNDTGDPDYPTNWNPNYGSLRLPLDIWPGLTTLADVAILPITGFIAAPGSQFETAFACNIPVGTPDVQSLSQPYGSSTDTDPLTFTINGAGFGDVQGSGTVTLDGVSLTVASWITPLDTPIGAITISMSALSAVAPGPHQLLVTNADGQTSPTGITFHVLGAGYDPDLVHVDINTQPGGNGTPNNPYNTIQDALDHAADGDLILVHPGVYYENIIIDENLKLQGYGPGASIVDGRFFGLSGIGPIAFDNKVAGLAYDGPTAVPHGQTVTVLAEKTEFGASYPAQIDGLAIRGATRFNGEGAGLYAHAYARYLQISNSLIQSNAGQHGGGIRLGLPYTPNPDAGNALNAENDFVRIHHNRILNNGGILLAGGVALFNGAEGYEIDHNVICGNYSAEYGGGISNFGYTSGSIHDNEILFNNAFDEGGGIMIAGELSPTPGEVSIGTGDIDILRNRIQGNVSNDDGGGVRLLQPVAGKVRIVNNMIVDNLATDTGGGIALDDALYVEIINNTVARNVSTATAEDADRTSCNPAPNGTCPHGAGLVSEPHSAALMTAYSPLTSFSDPVLFNNIFWQNEAFYLNGTTGLYGGGFPSGGYLDLEVLSLPGHFSATYSDCTAFTAHCPDNGNNLETNPQFVEPVNLTFEALAFAGDPAFITVLIKSTPDDPQGDYHLPGGSPAVDKGAASVGGVNAPCDDFDGDGRPNGAAPDIGADEQPGGTPCTPPPPPTILLYFSTAGDFAVPGVAGPYDDADIYAWNGVVFSRIFDASAASLPTGADVDALVVEDSDTFYISFNTDAGTSVPTLGTVQDEDIVKYDTGTWTLYFDGSDVGLGDSNAEDVDAFEILPGGAVIVSTTGNPTIPGVTTPTPADEDLFQCAGSFGPTTTCNWSYYFEGSDVSLNTAASEDVDGVAVSGADLYLSTLGAFSVTGLSGGGEDVFICSSVTTGAGSACASYTMFFDGSANGITGAGSNLDAIDVP